jgi:hypothetical protein
MKECLTHEQELERNLPQSRDAKRGSTRYKKFEAKYGEHVHEVEALPVAEQSRLLEEAIQSVLDIDAYNAEVRAEEEDAKKLAALRERAGELLADIEEEEE